MQTAHASQFFAMTPERQRHLDAIKHLATSRIDRKYRAGQDEHGGSLFEKPLGEEIIAEAIDQVIYAMTKREQDMDAAAFLAEFVNRHRDLAENDLRAFQRIIRLLR